MISKCFVLIDKRWQDVFVPYRRDYVLFQESGRSIETGKGSRQATRLLVGWYNLAQRQERLGSLQGREGGGNVCGDVKSLIFPIFTRLNTETYGENQQQSRCSEEVLREMG